MGKTIVITGAGQGLGRAVARRLAADGHRLVLLGRTPAKVEAVAAELGGGAYALACDVTSADSVRAAFAAIAERSGTIDVLINNAAVYEPFTVAEATDAQILQPILTNFAGPVFCVRGALPLLGPGGAIIMVSSESIHLNYHMLSLYQSSKAGLERFTDALREEVRGDGIRVTTVRAGAMMDEQFSWSVDPDVGRRFMEGNLRNGIDQRARPMSRTRSVAEVFHMLVALPDDTHLRHVNVEGWRP